MTSQRLGVAAAVVEGETVAGDVAIADGRISAIGCAPAGGTDLAIPGLIDLHVHGCGGVDFVHADRAGYRAAGRRLLAGGVTTYQPTFVSAPLHDLELALAELAGLPADDGPLALGAHLEGPFLAPGHMGAHNPRFRMDPDGESLGRLLAAGPVTEVTLAPERRGALALIAALADRGVVVSIGHTDATAAQARAAFSAGARSVTHLFNAMRPLHHRDPGVIGAALCSDDVVVEVVVDGHHLDADVVRLIWRAASGRVALVTDGTAAAGMTDGTYTIGDIVVASTGGAVRDADGALAGSALTMIAAVRNTVALGVPLEAAIGAATRVPARLSGRDDIGDLAPGMIADVVVVDDRLTVRRTVVGGRTRYTA